MENNYRFFENTACEFYPCHKGMEKGRFNCLFCFCPFYLVDNCPGNPTYIDGEKGKIRDCSNCLFPHIPENYDKIIGFIVDYNKKR